jgi:hypothetical protein
MSILLIILVIILLGGFGGSLYTGGFGYGVGSHGLIGVILIVLVVLLLMGRL